jgi:pyruvate, orthophosphate dikinase
MLISVFDKLDEDKATSAYLGGKGHGLWWMQQQGVNVPPALILPTTACVQYMKNPKGMQSVIESLIPTIKHHFVEKFGYLPLLSIRSGARVSMPGMMDTILNVGLDDDTIPEWQARLGDKCVIDSYKRLITMYGNVVKGVPREKLEHETAAETLKAYSRATHEQFPSTDEQILRSVFAVFDSWNNERAKVYRKMHNIPEDWGTAVVIQAMVFGNLNENSGTGVLFTRNPDTGADAVSGEFLTNAQGEDVVAGIRTPMSLGKMPAWNLAVANELLETVEKLEKAKRDVQDVEFTIQDGKLFILQTRNAKRSARAAVKIAFDMVMDGLITKEEAIKRVSARELDLADQPVIDPKFKSPPAWTGIPACSGVAIGIVATSAEKAVQFAAAGKKVVMVTEETTPDDIKGMAAAVGVLTMTGGSTSHAAVVARSMNRVCVVGLGVDHSVFTDGETISIDGGTGRVWRVEVPVLEGSSDDVGKFKRLILGESALLVTKAPKFKVDRLYLDLSSTLLDLENAKARVFACLGQCKELGILLPDNMSEADAEVLSVFLSPAELEQRVLTLRLEILDMPSVKSRLPSITLLGWESPGAATKPVVNPKSLHELVMLDKSGLMIGELATDPATVKVCNWLQKDGIELTPLNSQGAVASWTVTLHGT